MEPCCFRPTSSTKASRVLRPARPSSTWYSLKSWLVSQVRNNVTNIGTFTAKGPPCIFKRRKDVAGICISNVYCTSVFSPRLTVPPVQRRSASSGWRRPAGRSRGWRPCWPSPRPLRTAHWPPTRQLWTDTRHTWPMTRSYLTIWRSCRRTC